MKAWAEVLAHVVELGFDGGRWTLTSVEDRGILRIVASSGLGWDHVSVSRSDRIPTWTEMEQVRRAFFRDDETAMQLHVPASDHVNYHPFCLHMWRPLRGSIPRPPAELVGPLNATMRTR